MIRSLILIACVAIPIAAIGQFDIEKPPIEYCETKDDNLVTKLVADINDGDVKLTYNEQNGYLRSLLKHLDIPVSSQTLVFSKTSMQVRYISPRNPRAIYFNDDVYVGWVRGSSLMEISTSDPKLGAVFYTVDMTPRNADIQRANYDCLACHSTTMSQGVPGHTVRSVQPMVDGTIDSQRRSYITDHSSPFAERWGGWYVTGRNGGQKHMGNATLRGGKLVALGDVERLSVRGQFDILSWLSPYSDIVALMVLEHQTQMHNTLTRANFVVRYAIYDHNTAYGLNDPSSSKPVPEDAKLELQATIQASAKEVVDHMLFKTEIPLESEVKGLLEFTSDFVERGPHDKRGRSLRDFDLKTRLFKYPCSYLIYSSSFDSLEKPLHDAVLKQLHAVLNAEDSADEYSQLGLESRRAILQILKQTKSGLPRYWKTKAPDVHATSETR